MLQYLRAIKQHISAGVLDGDSGASMLRASSYDVESICRAGERASES